MGFTRYALTDYNFILTKVVGDIADIDLLEHVQLLNGETQGLKNLLELADCRDITSMDRITVQGTVDSSQAEINKPGGLLALLITDSPLMFGMARAYQTFAAHKRQNVEIFKDLDEALAWLTDDADVHESLKKFVGSV